MLSQVGERERDIYLTSGVAKISIDLAREWETKFCISAVIGESSFFLLCTFFQLRQNCLEL